MSTELRSLLWTTEYDFLRNDKHLGNNIILLALGGSRAYGTNIEGSDVDLRGCALHTKREILTGNCFEQFTDTATDTVIYSFSKLITLLTNANPNVLEMLGCRDYIYVSPIGQELLDHAGLFLSQKAAQSFGCYAMAQLRRLDNKAMRHIGQEGREKHILNSIKNASASFPQKYALMPGDSIRLYLDRSTQEGMESEIFMDVNLHHYPLRDYEGMWSEMHNIVRDYAKIGKRNAYAAGHDKLGKHMMHLIRLYMMCLDILERGEIVTYREKEHDLLMDIRNGKYLDANGQPISEFFEILDTYEKRLDYARANTILPEQPDFERIQDFVESVNERIVLGKTEKII